MAIKKFNAVSGISVGDDEIVDVIDSVGNVTANNLSITNVTTIANVSNLKIAGGGTNYVLKTDGSSNLSWGLDSASPGGNTTEVQINNAGSFSGNANFTFNGTTLNAPNISATGNISASHFSGNGSTLSALTFGNITTFNNAGLTTDELYLQATTRLNVTASGSSGYVFDQYGVAVNPTIYINSGQTLAFNLDVSGHPFLIQTSSSADYSTGLVHVDTTGTVVSGSSAQGQIAGTLYWKVPYGIEGNYKYQCSIHGGMNGNIVVTDANIANLIVSSASTADTVTTNAQPNITSVGTLTSLTVSGATNLGDASNLTIGGGANGYLLGTDGNGDVSWQNKNFLVTSNVTHLVSGSALQIVLDSANVTYPGGIFTLVQLGPVALTTTDIWASGATSKNAYSNFVAGTVNTQNVSITLSLANATFQIQSSDSITIGSSVITGANLVSLGITANGSYTIPSSYFSSAVQIAATSTVSANLTSSRGVQTSTGVTLTTLQPVPFNVTNLSGSFASSTVPYWNLNQTFNWTATLSAGATVAGGNITYANASVPASGSLTSTGTTSGTSPSLDSTFAYSLSTSDFRGEGRYGAGSRTIPSTVTGTVSAATKYYPLFYKTTGSSSNPTFTNSDTNNANNFTTGQGANTTATTTNYLWIATPNSTSHTFSFTFLGSQVVVTPDVTYLSQTISSQTYNVYGFTNYSAITFIYTTS